MCYNRTKVDKSRINTDFSDIFDWTKFAQKHKIHSNSEGNLPSLSFAY